LQESVNLDALGQPGPRSSTCILVKNLPFGTTEASLRALFTPFGSVDRLLVPPSGTIAVVEMNDAASMAAAWRGLVYKQIGGSVLYLEKAPAAIWSSSTQNARSAGQQATPSVLTRDRSVDNGDSEEPAAAGATLFVKNLNFETTVPRLKAAFDHLPDFSFARVQTKPDARNPGKTLSMGFGFVGFRNVKAATAAKEARQGYVLDGHALELRFAQRNADRSVAGSEGSKSKASSTTTKLLVKNVPFEATRAELRELFGCVFLDLFSFRR
jgi:multiple RNA-binding domain-containing protein 1